MDQFTLKAGIGAEPAAGSVAALLRERDWGASPLGDPAGWPQALRTVTDLMLGSKFAMFAAWGPELGMLYNDAYAEILGAKHPAALGARLEDTWREIWPEIAPLVASALAGEAVYREDLPLKVHRRGYEEDAWFTFSYSAVRDESGAVGGMICVVSETSAKARSAQRQALRMTLDEVLANRTEPEAMVAEAVEAFAKHLGAARVGYAEAAREGEGPAPVGRYAEDGRPFEVSFDEPGPSDAGLTVRTPVMRDERLCAWLQVEMSEPRLWLQEDLRLIEHVAARIWDAGRAARAERLLRESEARFRNMADHAPVMMWVTDPEGACSYLNQAWYEFTGQTQAQALGYGWLETTHPDDKARTEAVFLGANAAHEPFRIEYRLCRADGAYHWVVDAAAPRFGEDGAYLGYVGSVIDIHERKLAAEHQSLLINELNHRVKNTLATVQSMAAQTVRAGVDSLSAHEAFMARLMALSAAHNLLTEQRWTGAQLHEVIEAVARTFSERPGGQFRMHGPRVWLPPKAALALAMAFHELATNASKYGSLSEPGGTVAVTWSTDGAGKGRRLRLTWRERGGPAVKTPLRRGFGSRLLERGLAAELEGTVRLDFQPGGLVCEVEAAVMEA